MKCAKKVGGVNVEVFMTFLQLFQTLKLGKTILYKINEYI